MGNILNAYIKDSKQTAKACVIWLHGLGANAQDMMGIADLLSPDLSPLRHVFIDAPIRSVTLNGGMQMRAWYDIVGLGLGDRQDREGILASEQLIQQAIDQQLDNGFKSQQIFLAGFSQGGAMALFSGLRSARQLGGIIALSGYLPLVSEIPSIGHPETPIFMAIGEHDPIVQPSWTKLGYDWLVNHHVASITWRQYPMEHTICPEEMRDLSSWFSQVLGTSFVQETNHDDC